MSSRILHTASAAPNTIRGRRVRNLLVAILVPVLLAVAYLAGMSGADARTTSLPALIVNEDEMAEQTAADGTTTQVIAGRLLVSALTDPANAYGFSWGLANAATAEAALASGEAYAVVTIPADFSSSIASLGSNEPTPARITVTTDQSHDYLAGQAMGALTNALTAEFGTEITEMVAVGLAEGFSETGSAMQQAADGAAQLATGANQLGTGFDAYTTGQQQITDGLSQSSTGASELSTGVSQYTAGVDQFSSGVTTYTTGVSTYVDGVATYSTGADQLADGVIAIDDGIGDVSQSDLDGLAQLGPGLQQAGEGLASAKASYDQLSPALDAAETSAAALAESCAKLEDPADQATCTANLEVVAGANAGAKGLLDGIFSIDFTQLAAGLQGAADLMSGLPQLIGGIGQAADGARALKDGSVQLRDGGAQLQTGGAELATGGGTLSANSSTLSDGVTQLASGLAQLSEGQAQLAAGNPQIRDGMTQLSGGATELSDGLQTGADAVNDALGDPATYGEALANPLSATVVSQHSPGFGGMLLSLVLPLVVWLAALVSALARRSVTRDGLASTATNGRLLRRGFAKIALPVAIAAVVVTVVGHIWAGVPLVAVLGTLTFGLLAAGAVAAIHLLLVALWGRRFGAIASLAFLALQLLALRGFLPLEFKAPWLDVIGLVSPVAHASAGLQLVYAGGGAGAIVQAVASLVLIGLIALLGAGLTIARKRVTSLARVVDLRALRAA